MYKLSEEVIKKIEETINKRSFGCAEVKVSKGAVEVISVKREKV